MQNQTQGQGSCPDRYDDEISLVDLASILIKRWKAMAVIFAVIVLATLAYALMVPRTYSYTSLYGVAEKSPDNALERPEALVAKARNLYLGPETRQLLANIDVELEALPFETHVTNPAETLLISVRSEATEGDTKFVEQLHKKVLKRLQDGQGARADSRKKSLQQQLESTQKILDATQQSSNLGSGEVVSSLMGRITELKSDLADLRKGEITQTGVKSLQPTGTSRKLTLALGIVLGGLLAVMGAFFMHFANLVCSRLKKER